MSDDLKYLDDSNFDKEIESGVTLVDFYAEWCGPCKMIGPIMEELAKELKGKAKIAKLDIEASQNTTAREGVTSIPTVILFKDGKEVNRIVGVRDKDTFRSLINSAI